MRGHPAISQGIGQLITGSINRMLCLWAGSPYGMGLIPVLLAGKSTYLRQVALIIIMAQIGSFVPASFASIRCHVV